MMATLAGAAATPVATCIVTYFRKQKGVQRLDPIATIMMLALRTLKCNEGAKPGAVDDALDWYKEMNTPVVAILPKGFVQATSRAYYQVGNDDMFFMRKALILFLKGWSPTNNHALVKIVDQAIDGLKLLQDQYAAENKGAALVAEAYGYCLKDWKLGKVRLPPEKESEAYTNAHNIINKLREEKKPEQENAVALLTLGLAKVKISLFPPDHAEDDDQAIKKIQEIWTKGDFEAFANNLDDKESKTNTLKQFLTDQNVKYQKNLEK